MALAQEYIGDAVHHGCGNGDGAEASKLWRSDSDNAAARIYDGSADRGWLQADIEPNVG